MKLPRRDLYDPALMVASSVIAVIIGLRLVALYVSPLGLQFDEAQYWSWSRDLDFGYYSKPPMIAWLIALTTSLYGHAEWAVRFSSPLIHGLTAMAVFLLTRTVGGSNKAAIAACVAYITLPGVAWSSFVISTDMPLLLFWTLALICLWKAIHAPQPGQGKSLLWAGLCGLAIGLGMLSKYAMIYFPVCLLLLSVLSGRARAMVLSKAGTLMAGVAFLVVLPNLIWNAQAGWVTFGHTADNANWRGVQFDLGMAFEFLAGQFAVFGPLLFLLLGAWLLRPQQILGSADDDREELLFLFSVPVLGLMLAQSVLSRAHANWAAVTYIAALVALCCWLTNKKPRLLLAAIGLNALLSITIGVLSSGVVFSDLGQAPKPFHAVLHRMTAWPTLVDKVKGLLELHPDSVLMFDDRKTISSFLYYGRGVEAAGHGFVMAPQTEGSVPHNHFELTRSWKNWSDKSRNVVYVSSDPRPEVIDQFLDHAPIGRVDVPTVGKRHLSYDLVFLSHPIEIERQ